MVEGFLGGTAGDGSTSCTTFSLRGVAAARPGSPDFGSDTPFVEPARKTNGAERWIRIGSLRSLQKSPVS
jgi:hypothetical protein